MLGDFFVDWLFNIALFSGTIWVVFRMLEQIIKVWNMVEEQGGTESD
jgi:hypothetical protein